MHDRYPVGLSLATPATIVAGHGLAAVIAEIFAMDIRSSATTFSFVAVAIAIVVGLGELAIRHGKDRKWTLGTTVGAGGAGAAVLAIQSATLGGGAVLAAAAFGTAGMSLIMLRVILARLPEALDGRLVHGSFHKAARVTWAIISVVAIYETSRVTAFMADRDSPGTTDWVLQRVADHDCMGGYIYGADLNRRGAPNIYDIAHYPLGTPNVDVRPDPGIPPDATTVNNLAPYVLDNLQYPPPFLLLPRAGLALSNDYLRIRTLWFVVQWFGLALVAFALATWVSGRVGAMMCLLIPLFLVSGPASLGLQRGQFHPTAWWLAIGAMLLFERRRTALGGAMLSFAVLSKIFPGVLGIYMIITRRWSAVLWTFGFAAVWIALTLIVSGTAPFERFVDYQFPRLTSGEAFAWCFERLTCVTNNQAPYGVPFKLFRIGWLSDPKPIARAIHSLFPFVVVALAIWAGRRAPRDTQTTEDRAVRARTWTSLAMVASLMPDLVPATYSPMGTFLTLMLLAGLVRNRWAALGLAVAWLAAFQLPASPTSDFKVGLSAVTALILLGVNAWTVFTAKGEPVEAESASSNPSAVARSGSSSG